MRHLIPLRTCLIVWLAAWVAGAAGQDEILQNPSFEGDYESIAPGWRRVQQHDGALVFAAPEGDQTHAGTKCQRVTCSEFRSGRVMLVAVPKSGARFASRQSYEASLWVRADRRMVTVELLALDASARPPRVIASDLFAVDQAWRQLVLRFYSAAESAHPSIGIAFAQEGTLWVDDASLRPWTGLPTSTPPKQGNLVPNAWFQFGMDGWHTRGPIAADFGARARRGPRALRVRTAGANGEVLTSGLAANPGREHVLSMSLMARPPRKHVRIGVVCGDLERPVVAFEKEVAVAKQWQRLSVRGSLPAAPRDRYRVRVMPGPGRGAMWIDAVQLEEASIAKPFRPASPLRATVSINRADGFYNPGEAVTVTASCHNSTLRIVHRQMAVTVEDAWGKQVDRRVLEFDAVPGEVKKPLALKLGGKTGAFRVRVQGASRRDELAEATVLFTVRPQGATLAPRGPGYFGVQFAAPTAAGAAGSDAAKRVDALVARWHSQGVALMGALPWPAVPAEVSKLVARCRGRVAAWELSAPESASAHEYVAALSAVYGAVKEADQAAAIVATCSTAARDPGEWLGELIDLGGREFFDAVGYRNVSVDEWSEFRYVEQMRQAMAARGRPAPICASGSAPAYAAKLRTRETPLERAARVVRGVVTRRAAGVDRAFLGSDAFDAGLWSSLHPSAQEVARARMFVEPALALAMKQLHQVRYIRQMPIPGVYAFAFDAGAAHLIVLWAAPVGEHPIHVKLQVAGPTEAMDFMGNLLTSTRRAGNLPLEVDREPIYVTMKLAP